MIVKILSHFITPSLPECIQGTTVQMEDKLAAVFIKRGLVEQIFEDTPKKTSSKSEKSSIEKS